MFRRNPSHGMYTVCAIERDAVREQQRLRILPLLLKSTIKRKLQPYSFNVHAVNELAVCLKKC